MFSWMNSIVSVSTFDCIFWLGLVRVFSVSNEGEYYKSHEFEAHKNGVNSVLMLAGKFPIWPNSSSRKLKLTWLAPQSILLNLLTFPEEASKYWIFQMKSNFWKTPESVFLELNFKSTEDEFRKNGYCKIWFAPYILELKIQNVISRQTT